MDPYWKNLIREESQQDYFKKLVTSVQTEAKDNTIYPDNKLVYSALNLCPFDSVKVVILGQDPYHGPNQAHGLAFSVQPGILIPPSLLNLFKEIQSDLGLPIPLTGCLTPWAEQGVLLLNTVLTVSQGKPGSHAGFGWEIFTDKIISRLNGSNSPMIFLLWGAAAKAKKKLIDNHPVLEASHPSPLGVNKGFKGCKHFSQANLYLEINNLKPIDWSLK
jgi:uracil-DNA glycosylase